MHQSFFRILYLSRRYIIQVGGSMNGFKTLVDVCFGHVLYSPNCCMNLSGLHCATVEVGVVLRALRVLYPALGDSIRRREIRCSSMGLPFALTARSFSLLVIHDRHQNTQQNGERERIPVAITARERLTPHLGEGKRDGLPAAMSPNHAPTLAIR